jgi:hypothetical protein
LVILFVVIVAAVVVRAIPAAPPGRIARAWNHPRADAINVRGCWRAPIMGILMPLAFV